FIENIGEVILDGLLADGEFGSDFFVRQSFHNGTHDLQFSSCKAVPGGELARLVEFSQRLDALDHIFGGLLSNPISTVHHALDAIEKDSSRRLLEYDATSAELERTNDLRRILCGSQYDVPWRIRSQGKVGQYFQP